MTSRRLALTIALGMLLLALAGFGALRVYKSSPKQKQGYSVELTELKNRFNADKGKVRLLLILSPT